MRAITNPWLHYDAWLDLHAPDSREEAQPKLLTLLLTMPLATPLRDDAPEPGYADVTLETAVGEILGGSGIDGIHDTATALLIRAARGHDIRQDAITLLTNLADEYGK